MIIQCEKCRTKFNLDDSLLKREGSKVRCSLCTHIFVAYPPEQIFNEEGETIAVNRGELADALVQDVPPAIHEEATGIAGRAEEIDFEDVFEESLADLEKLEAVSTPGPHEPGKGESPVAEESPEQAFEKEEPFQDDAGVKAEKESKEYTVPSAALFTEERPAKSHALVIISVIILILLGTGAAIFVWAPELIPDYFSFLKPAEKQELTDTGVRRLSFKGVTGSFVESKKTGHLFVIGGTVVNNYPKSRSFILINGSILDEKGEVVKKKLAYAGNSLKEEEMKTMPLEEISKAMKNRYGRNGGNFNVAPGATVPFTIVFENLPENLSEFTVEAVSSSPGT
jgi:predicted Zn finger-like uncharacterized protein